MRQLLLILTAVLLFSGCFCKEPTVIEKIETVTVTVPVPCDVPDPECQIETINATRVIPSLLDCIARQKKAADTCRPQKNVVGY